MTAKFNSVKKVSFKVNNIKEDMARLMFNRSYTLVKAGKQCVVCGERAEKFRDEIGCKDYNITGLCQKCQDNTFVEFDNE